MKAGHFILTWMGMAIFLVTLTVGAYALLFWMGAKIVKAVWGGG